MRIYCVCLDGAPPNLLARFANDGTLPNLGRLLSKGSWSRALPSLPTITSVNWTTIATGQHCGTHGRPRSVQRLRYFWEAAEEHGIPVGLANIEHNEITGSTFFIGHAPTLADAFNLNVTPRKTTPFTIGDEETMIAEGYCTIDDEVEIGLQGAVVSVPPNTMSDYVIFTARDPEHTQVCTRFKYASASSTLYISPVRAMSGFAQPASVERKILSLAGPPPVRGFPLFHKGVADLDTALEEEEAHATWFGRVAGQMNRDNDTALWFHRHNTMDGVGHYYLGLVDPLASSYDAQRLEENWAALRRWYATVDLILGEILKRDPEARFAMCTDHGNVGFRRLVSLGRLFVDNGLAHPRSDAQMLVDQDRSQLHISSNEIFVQQEICDDQSPEGRALYEDLRNKAIELLRGLVDPENSGHVVALAIKKEDAKSLLYWGDTRGDILYFLEPGYLCPGPYIMEDVFKSIRVPGHTSEHFGPMPGYETEVGSTYSFMMFSGYAGGSRDLDSLGPVHLVDFAPTVLAMLGLSAPWLQGRVLHEMLGPDGRMDEWIPKACEYRNRNFQAKEDWLNIAGQASEN